MHSALAVDQADALLALETDVALQHAPVDRPRRRQPDGHYSTVPPTSVSTLTDVAGGIAS